jgi:type IV pilus assembly protein PilY1
MKNSKKVRNRAGVRALACSVALLVVLTPLTGLAQDECEIPLFVKQNLTGANVMILADNSGSMNAATYHLAYDPSVDWSGDFATNSTYFIGGNGNYGPTDFNTGFDWAPDAALVVSDNGQWGRYQGNYLNWIYYHATPEQRAGIPQETRIQVLKSVLDQVVARSARLRFGLAVFDFDNGGHVIGKIGSDHATLRSQIAGITANTWTPLGEATETVLDEYRKDGPDAPIEVPCQFNFNIIVTDGLPTMDRDVSEYLHDADGDGNDPGNCASIGAPYDEWNDCSDHFDDVTYWMANHDLRPDLEGDQNAYSYVVGFHESSSLLQEAAVNGQGLFFHAENAPQLVRSIEYAIQDILRRISAGSAVAVVSTERGTDDRLYRGKFMPIDWNGFLESYTLPYNDGDTALWEAGSIMSAASTDPRYIFTGLGGTTYSFRESSAPSLREALGAATDEEAADLINWGRGDDVAGYRDRRGWILGDIVHSTPVVVGAPSDFVVAESYQDFQSANKNRRKMVYVGANDGMLHGFDAVNGGEVWAFVPEFALPAFSAMADSYYCHTYTCDQTVSVKDILLGGTWRTILFGGGREGGASIFALDVTNPNGPSLMWQSDLPNGKDYHSEIEVGSIAGTPVAIVGSGLDVDTGEAMLYVFDAEDGTPYGERELSTDPSSRNKATRPTLVDLDLDGQTDLVYMADYLGSVWRFEIGDNPDPATWDKTELYRGVDAITADPVAAFGAGGDVYIYFGSGAYMEDGDMITTDQEYFFCIFDNHSDRNIDKADLQNQTNGIGDVTSNSGWYVSLWNETGERVTEQAVVVAETVIFTSFAPTLDACVAGGTSYLYQMKYDNGGIPDSDDMEDPDDRSSSLGEGIASYPVVDLTEGTVVVQSSDASINVAPIASMFQRLTVRSWQESYDHVDNVTPPVDVQ